MAYLLQQDGYKLLQQDGYDILLDPRIPSRLSKVVAWENKVPFPIKYCITCRALIPANHRDYLYCEACDRKIRIKTIREGKEITKTVVNSLSYLKVDAPETKKVSKSLPVKKPDVYGRYDGDTLHLKIKKQ